MRIGIIGLGNIGTMMTKAFATQTNFDIYVYTRTAEKAEELAQTYAKVQAARTVADVPRQTEIVFICTKAGDARTIIREIGPLMNPSQILVPTISSVPAAEWEEWTTANVAKVIPSVAQSKDAGNILVVYGKRCTGRYQDRLEQALCAIASPFQVEEEQLRIASDLTSCGPAFAAALMQSWALAAGGTGRITRAEAEHLIIEMWIGVAKLLQGGAALSDVIGKVALPGGVTAAGICSLQEAAPSLFRNLHEATERASAKTSKDSNILTESLSVTGTDCLQTG